MPFAIFKSQFAKFCENETDGHPRYIQALLSSFKRESCYSVYFMLDYKKLSQDNDVQH